MFGPKSNISETALSPSLMMSSLRNVGFRPPTITRFAATERSDEYFHLLNITEHCTITMKNEKS